VGLVCRVVEEAGIPTVCVSTGRDLTAQVKPPRSLFLNFPMGNNFGEPFNKKQQAAILGRALQLIEEVETGGLLEDWPEVWSEPVEYFKGRTAQSS
jgi:D-proline reductase (dithiol) PrdB